MNVILTGVTGTLGSQVLYQLLQQKEIAKIYLLIRKKGKVTAKQRLKKVLDNPAAPSYVLKNKDALYTQIKVLETTDFLQPNNYLSVTDENYFIHSAGCVNLSTDVAQKEIIYAGNLEFTKTIFTVFSKYIKKFSYISTAFSIGDVGGLIGNDYHGKIKPKFRNFYEASKHATEQFLLEKEAITPVEIQILRPSVLGGNVYDTATYFISNYMVYYLLGKFFYNNPLLKNNSIRFAINTITGLNIVPVDYVAKVIATVFIQNVSQLNIVQAKSTNVLKGMKKILEAVGFKEYTFVNTVNNDFVLDNKNRLENIYYKTIGLHLNRYLTSIPYEFDTTILEAIVSMPKYNIEDYLANTIIYAKQHDFEGEQW